MAKLGIAAGCGANCSVFPEGSLDVLARAVLLVVGMAIPDHDRLAALKREAAIKKVSQAQKLRLLSLKPIRRG